MTLRSRFDTVLSYFRENVPVAQSELNFSNPYELIVAVILSAQCTDKRVNLTTPELFRKYPGIDRLAAADEDELFEIIRSISYPRSKAGHLIGMAKGVMERYSGEIPDSVDELMTLPGVGRKTANVVTSIVWGKAVIAVDTHVFRVSRRLGLSKGSTPRAVELDLEAHIPENERPIAHHWLILFGRYTCTARKPHCEACPFTAICRKR